MYPCPFRLEKPSKAKKGFYSASESDDSLDIEELADFNKLMEKHLKESLKMEFHEKFHKINKIQNKEIDKKLLLLAKQRNAGQLKYLLKKRVNNFKENIGEIKVKLEALDDEIVDPEDNLSKIRNPNYFMSPSDSKRSRSQPNKLGKATGKGRKMEEDDEQDHMKKALSRKYKMRLFEFLGFKRKYKVESIEDVMRIISRVKNKDVEEKFSKFLSYFKQSMKPSKASLKSKKSEKSETLEQEMLDEISNFVSSSDFNRFYKKCNFPL